MLSSTGDSPLLYEAIAALTSLSRRQCSSFLLLSVPCFSYANTFPSTLVSLLYQLLCFLPCLSYLPFLILLSLLLSFDCYGSSCLCLFGCVRHWTMLYASLACEFPGCFLVYDTSVGSMFLLLLSLSSLYACSWFDILSPEYLCDIHCHIS